MVDEILDGGLSEFVVEDDVEATGEELGVLETGGR